ncbi:MAG TPA: ribulokinase [Candidatus Limnocylindrales bacterium]|nr:ribulokinase [Candidatus Limnocylindrales bacterium]
MTYAVGLDFGTESGRAVLVDLATGAEVATAIHEYANGVIDRRLPAPDDDVVLEPDWALQDPDDYVATIRATVPKLLADTGVDPTDVVGLGIDFTACTMLPTTADGTPLSRLPEFRRNPHAWVKLWKHHAAQPEADRINAAAETRRESWLPRYGGRISSEWFYSKSLQILDEAPAIYAAADRLIEAADWVIWQLTGVETRNSCTAGYKAIWSKADGFPSSEYFRDLDPRFASVVDDKMSRDVRSIGERAGELSAEAAAWTGLRPGTAVAIANVDAHVSVPAVGVTEPGTMVAVMGTSTCHMVLGSRLVVAEGMCGVVEDGIIPGYFGYEAGQSAVGDIFAWFTKQAVPPQVHEQARHEGSTAHAVLERDAARMRPGENGLLALDWWNGNRSILVDVELSGLLVGATLATTPADIYRALLESTAFGTRAIIESLEGAGVAVEKVVACGGLPERNELLMQLSADITGRDFEVAASSQAPALGAAMHGAVAAGAAAGGYDSIEDAAAAMVRPSVRTYRPDPAVRAVYDGLFTDYMALHDHFGRGGNDVMRRLRGLRARQTRTESTPIA